MLMPGRSGSLINGEWAEGGSASLDHLIVEERIENQPLEYVARESIEFVAGFASEESDEFVAYIDPEATSGTGGEGSGLYRYGFNGKENDNEVKGEGNQQDYGMRIYDGRLGRFLSVDPLTKSYPMLTPYQFASNRPIDGIDLDGLEWHLSTINNNLKTKAKIALAPPAAGIHPWNSNDKSLTEKWRDSKNFLDRLSYDISNGLFTLPQQLTASIRNEDYITNIGGNVHRAHGIGDENQRMSNFVNGATTLIPGAPTLKVGGYIDDVVRISANVADDGIDLTIKLKPTWSQEQVADAYLKAEFLTNSKTIITKNPLKREANLRSKFKKAGGQVNDKQHVDHTIDLQLGGTNSLNNLKAIDGSVNMSFGAQLRNQIQNLPDGTRVNKVMIIPKPL